MNDAFGIYIILCYAHVRDRIVGWGLYSIEIDWICSTPRTHACKLGTFYDMSNPDRLGVEKREGKLLTMAWRMLYVNRIYRVYVQLNNNNKQ